jgi:leader peptidase (prepilin peptidase)/N-methyltransferase
VEIITALFSVLLWYMVIPHTTIPLTNGIVVSLQALFLILMIPVAVIDFKHQIIPDSISLSLLAISFVVSFIPGSTTPLQSLLGILSGGGILWIIGKAGSILLKKGDAMGGGDIKLMAAAGALWGPEIALMGIVFGAFFGSLAGIPMLLFKRVEVDHRIPFGPFLGAGLWVSVVAGYFIVSSYIKFIDKLFAL